MKKNQEISEYKWKRDTWQKSENMAVSAYYQILIVQKLGSKGINFLRKSDFTQQKYILHDILDEILGIDDADYQNGIIHEVLLSEIGNRLSGAEKACRICKRFFEKSRTPEYVRGAYQLHISIILEIAKAGMEKAGMENEGMEKAGLYAENLLTLLDMRYGVESREYARMKLHIIGEFFYCYNRELFYTTFENHYDYFKQYTADCDSFFCDVVLLCIDYQVENGLGKQELWAERGEGEAERWRGNRNYGFYKCKSAWLRAKILEKRNQDAEALELLQDTIAVYVEKNGDKNSFYGPLYLLAANICRKQHEYHPMLNYAQQGLAVCKEFGQTYSEWYFSLNNYVGIWYLSQHNWREAEKLYGSGLQDIERNFGKENDNYVHYLNNLANIAMNQGRSALPYYEVFKRIIAKGFCVKCVPVLCNMLNILISSGTKLDDIEELYGYSLKNVQEEDRTQIDTIYMEAKANAGKFDKKFQSLAQTLQSRYQNNFTDEFAIVYWNSILMWQWSTGHFDKALEISKSLMRQIENTKDHGYISFAVNHIQLLVLNGQFTEAEKQIFPTLDWLYECILDTGCGDFSRYLLNMRRLLSIYIYLLKQGGECLRLDQETGKQLLDRIICCKTIEREMRGLLGKYDKDDQIELRRYKELHRKLAALEIWGKGGPDAKECQEEHFCEQEIRCLSEQAEYEASVNEEISFHDKIRKYRLEELNIPCASICAEYFAYYHFSSNAPILELDIEQGICNFLVFILKEEGGHAILIDVIDIPVEMKMEDVLTDLWKEVEFSENDEEKNREAADAIQCLRQLFAEPVSKYIDKGEKIYLGLDFIMQFIPMDLIFCDAQGEPLSVILVESVRYVSESSRIHFEKENSLVIGNPQLSYLNTRAERIPCGELESMEIARMLGTKAYVGKEARQNLLWGKESRTIIHICAHGDLLDEKEDRLLQSNLFTDSFLKLAGYIDWKEGYKLRDYGNGVLSGDDFLFMDLSNTKLVVLSACESGLGYSKGLQAIHGMRWAIGTAGAENSITTLWEIDDVASGLLMVMFYRNLRSMPVSEALYHAKKCLRTITVEELRKDSVLWSIVEMGENGRKKRYGAKDRPYSHWRNWAAFVHYHR